MDQSYSKGFRGDIQGLRAIAVAFVVIYHVWPHYLPGGFVGVDVFFVISGYLITCHLREEIEKKGTLSLLNFYARRVRRLLPPASLVLIATLVAAFFIAPRFKLMDIAYDTLASTVYAQNWRLLFQSIDYLGAEEAAGPLQHFWSLAIEEQYYIIWPLLLLGLSSVMLRRSFRIGALWLVSVMLGLSLLASVLVTRSDQTVAYFATYTRIWELALGSFLAFVHWRALSALVASFAGWLGLAMIVVSAISFSAETAFPGYAALLPTVGTALLIWAGGNNLLHERGLSWAPMTFLGDISYSLYLWHWPIIVFAGYLGIDTIGLIEGMGLIVFSLVLAWWTKIFIEDRFRNPKRIASPARSCSFRARTVGLAVVCMGLSLTASASVYLWVLNQEEVGNRYLVDSLPGAKALSMNPQLPIWQLGELVVPSPELAREDMASSYDNGCHLGVRHTKAKGCDIGVKDGEKLVVLAGDSHAANWIPAFEVLAKSNNWGVISYTKSACSITLSDIQARGERYAECTEWSANVLDDISEIKPDLVVLGRSVGARFYESESRQASDVQAVNMLNEVFSLIRKSGAVVAVIRDTPRMPFDPLLCFDDKAKCDAGRDETLKQFDPLIEAANRDNAVALIDMTDGLCRDERCHVVEGNVIVWRDWHHLTETYSRTLAPLLGQKLKGALGYTLGKN
ncbi:acyltransferase family protein [Halomonas alimentaria]|uniref:acyltransferase family protein n=1 Tax=Halomonas alimentaria TaxID=147248 RepID=UPI00248F9912|nr:acyltransferase family protein [Halomonas alimentaria]